MDADAVQNVVLVLGFGATVAALAYQRRDLHREDRARAYRDLLVAESRRSDAHRRVVELLDKGDEGEARRVGNDARDASWGALAMIRLVARTAGVVNAAEALVEAMGSDSPTRGEKRRPLSYEARRDLIAGFTAEARKDLQRRPLGRRAVERAGYQ